MVVCVPMGPSTVLDNLVGALKVLSLMFQEIWEYKPAQACGCIVTYPVLNTVLGKIVKQSLNVQQTSEGTAL